MPKLAAIQKNGINPGLAFLVLNHLLFIVLFVFAFHYYQQRIYTDSAFYIYHVVNKQALHIELYRFVLGFSQALPLLLVKLKWSLKAVLIGYSIGHVLYFYLIWLWLAHVRKEPVVATLLVLTQTIGIISGYFTPMFELYYCNALLVAFYVMLKQYERKLSQFALLLVLVFFIATGHPLANLLVLFILAFHFEKHRLRYYRGYGVILALMAGIFIFKVQTADAYEQGKSAAFVDTLKHAEFGMAYAKGFVQFLFTWYKDVLLLGIISWCWFFATGQFFKGIIYTLFLAGILVMINGAHYGFEHTRYQEQVYFPLNFVVCFPFVVWVIGQSKPWISRTATALLVLVVAFKLVVIVQEAEPFNNRTALMKSLIAKAQTLEGNKFVVHVDEVTLPGYTEPNWSFAAETFLLSGINPTNKTVTICTSEDYTFNNNDSTISEKQFLFRRWNIVDDRSVNSKYFRIGSGRYGGIGIRREGTVNSK